MGAGEIEALSDAALQRGGPGPPADTILVNGTARNVNASTGHYSNVKMEQGKKYRLRLVSTAVDNSVCDEGSEMSARFVFANIRGRFEFH